MLGGASIFVMEPADTRDGMDDALAWAKAFPGIRRVSLQGQVRPAIVVIIEVVRDNPLQVSLRQNDHMVQALAS